MQQVLCAVGGFHADGVLCVEDEDDFAVLRGIDGFFRRVDEVAVAHHLAGEGLVGRFFNGVDGSRDGREERMRAGFCGGRFRCRSRFFGRFFRFRCCRRGCTGLHIGRRFEVRFEVCLDDGDLRAVDDLHARSLDDDTDSAGSLQKLLVYERRVFDGAAQARRAAVDGGDVLFAAEAAGNRRALGIVRGGSCALACAALLCLVVGLGVELRFLVIVFSARGFEVEVANHPGEDEVVEEEVDDADGNDIHPARFCLTLQDAEDEEIQKTAGEGQADGDIKHVRDHVSRTCENHLHGEKSRRDEEEGKLDGFRDAREHRGQGGGEEEASRELLLFGTRRAVHGESCARQAEDHEDEFAGEIARCVRAEMRDIRRGELGEEDVLAALDELAVDHHRAADARLPERQIKDVVQSEGDQGAFDDAENQRADIARARHKAAKSEDALLCERPDEVHGDADEEECDGGDDGNEPRAAEEGERVRQHDLVVLVVQPGDAESDDDAAEDAHLERKDAAAWGDRSLKHRGRNGAVGEDLAAELEHGVAGRVHDEEGDHGREGRDLLFRFGHADGDADGEDDRQIAEDGAACTRHDGEERVECRAFAENRSKTVRFYGRGIRKRRADAQEDTGDRQYGDGQHETSPDALEYAENFVFHKGKTFLSSALFRKPPAAPLSSGVFPPLGVPAKMQKSISQRGAKALD